MTNRALFSSLSLMLLNALACGMPLFIPHPGPPRQLSDELLSPGHDLTGAVVREVVRMPQWDVLYGRYGQLRLFAGFVEPALPSDGDVLAEWPDSMHEGIMTALRSLEFTTTGMPLRGLLDTSYNVDFAEGRTAPGASVLSVSRVGFNKDSTYAVIYYDFRCGPRCGQNALLVLLRKPGRRWTPWGPLSAAIY
jgi:hypothetical protein